jgi:hypothetical protein
VSSGRYGIALAAVVAATGARLAFQSAVGVYAPYQPFTLAVTVVSFFGGARAWCCPQRARSGLAVVSLYRLLGIENPAEAWAFRLFGVTASTIALLVGSLRDAGIRGRDAGVLPRNQS